MDRNSRWSGAKVAGMVVADLPESDRKTVRRWRVEAALESAVEATAPAQHVAWPATAAPVGEPPPFPQELAMAREAPESAARV